MENINSNEKFCTKCGKKFIAVGREVICPSCKAAAAEDAKRVAVLKAKRASWNGESVPVRISGRASTIIREYGAEKSLPFAQALDELLKASSFFQTMGKAWEDVTPYKSHRRDKHTDKHTTETTSTVQDMASKQDVQASKQDVQAAGKPQEVKPQEVKQAARKTVKTVTNKTTTSKAAAVKKVKA